LLSRPLRIAAAGFAAAGLAAGTVAVTSLDKAVALTVDDRTSTVHAFGSTVADVLDSEGIAVGEHDLVSPSPSARVKDGTEVVVRYGRKVTVTTDGVSREHWTTALTVAEALPQLGLRADGTKLSVSRSMRLGRSGAKVEAATRKNVRLTVAGKAASRSTYATSVAQLLAEAKVVKGPLDRLTPAPTARVANGTTVVLTRVQQKPAAVTKSVPFSTKSVRTSALAKGTTRTKTAGKLGQVRETYVDTFTNGRRTARKLTARTVVRKPVAKVVQVGTKPRPQRQESTAIPRSGGLNWASLARCESGGNPRAVNPNGHYGLYQFSLSTWAAVGGSGNPVNASVGEQTRRAQILYDRAGAGQWSCGSHLFD